MDRIKGSYLWIILSLVLQCFGNPIDERQEFGPDRFPRGAYPDPIIFAGTLESPSRSAPGSKFQPFSQYIAPQQASVYKNYPAIFNSGSIIFNEDYDEPLAPRPNFPVNNLGSFFPPKIRSPYLFPETPEIKPPTKSPTTPTAVGKIRPETKVKDQGSAITFPKPAINKKRPTSTPIVIKPTTRRPAVPTKPKVKVTVKPTTRKTTTTAKTTTRKVSVVEETFQERPSEDDSSDEALIEGSIYAAFKAGVKN